MSKERFSPICKATVPSRRALLIIFLAALLIAGLSVYVLRQASQGPFWGIKAGHSLRVQLSGPVGSTNRIRSAQIQARTTLLEKTRARSMSILDMGVEKDELVRITNTGRRTIQCGAFNEFSPMYRIEVLQGERWGALPYVFSPGGMVELKPGESLEFPVVVPAGNDPWRVGITYSELPAQNKLIALAEQGMALLGKKVDRKEKLFAAFSETHAD